ncbi:MAG: hypothetical protein NTU62_11665 [Spirochaetes bacterium]|nr:hypothetical protein [Spirochaetota bacterium]
MSIGEFFPALYNSTVNYWQQNAQYLGPIMTFISLLFALFLPWRRSLKDLERQDKVTIRGLNMYLSVLGSKLKDAIDAFVKVERLHALELQAEAGAKGRRVPPDEDPAVRSAQLEVQAAMWKRDQMCPLFDASNLVNYNHIEGLFVSSELSNAKLRKALLDFIVYFKRSPSKERKEQFEEEYGKLQEVLALCRPSGAK